MAFTKQRFVTEAHSPRHPWSTCGPQTLKTVYNVYTNPNQKPKVPEDHQLNLLFTHGNGFSKEIWEYTIQCFFDAFPEILGKVIAFDFANHGESYALNQGKLGWSTAWSDGGKDLIKIVKEQNLKGPLVLIGHSMGATQCLYASVYEPYLFDSIIAVDPVCSQGWNSKTVKSLPKEIVKKANTRLSRIGQRLRDSFTDEADYEDYMNNKSLHKSFDPKVLKTFVPACKVKNSDGTVSFATPVREQMSCFYAGGYVSQQTEFVLPLVECEVMHIIGTNDNFLPDYHKDYVRGNLKHVVPVDIEGGTHTVPYEKPDETFGHMKSFVLKRYERAVKDIELGKSRLQLAPEQRMELVDAKLGEVARDFPLNELYSKL